MGRSRTWLERLARKRMKATEIRRTEAAIRRYRGQLDDMSQHWRDVDGSCCPNCMFGAQWSDVEQRLGRTEKWLGVLKRKWNLSPGIEAEGGFVR